MKYHYVYIITNKLNHKFYIGKHSTDKLDDGYMGSGITIHNAILKYGLENFSKRILCFCDSALDALKVEEFLVTENLIKRDDCYNMTVGGQGGGYNKGHHHSEEAKIKISEGNKGRHHSYETKIKISKSNLGKSRLSGFKGKHHTEESKRKLSASSMGKSIKKYKWITQSGEIKEMYKTAVTRFHQDWILYEQN